jgi:hypothetical protein
MSRDLSDEDRLSRLDMKSLGRVLVVVGTLTALAAAGILLWARYYDIVEYLGILVYALFSVLVLAAGVVLAGIGLRIAAKSNATGRATDRSGKSRSAV